MPQALPAPSAATSPVTVRTGPQATETANSGQSFGDALSNELSAGDAPAATVTKDPAPAESVAAGPDKTTDAATLAAGGNSLPPTLPPDAMLTLSMLIPGAAPTPAASTVPAGSSEHDAAPRPDAPAQVPVNSTPVVMPAVALPPTTFALPVPEQAASKESSATVATAMAAATASKPAVLAQHVAATINSQNLSAVSDSASASFSIEVDPSTITTKTGAEQIGTLTESLKAMATPTRAEPVIDTASLTTPTRGSAESMAALTNTLSTAGTDSTVPSTTVSVPFGQPAWGQALGNQVVWAMNQGLPAAALHLSPPELGPVSVHIRLDQDQASIAFSSPHVAVRDAIEAAMPRLRDMLGNQGIALVDVNVSQHGSSHAQAQAQDYTPGGGRAAIESRDDGLVMTGPVRQTVLGVLDLYA